MTIIKKIFKPIPLLIIASVITLTIILTILSNAVIIIVRQNNLQNKTVLSGLIIDAVDNLNSPAPADPRTGAIYFRHMQLQLPPASVGLGDVVYRYEINEGSEVVERINIASQRDIDNAKSSVRSSNKLDDMFKEVPKLQSCARGVVFSYTPSQNGETLLQEKQLKNGKKLYMYTEAQCANEAFNNYIKNIDSY